jgi:hypothetical protein
MSDSSELPQAPVSRDLADAKRLSRPHGRRAFLLGAAVPVVTLASRPALGTTFATVCTRSGMMSGNLSKPSTANCSGLTPGYWKNHPNSWAINKNAKFKDIFGIAPIQTPNATLFQCVDLQAGTESTKTTYAHTVAALLNSYRFGEQYYGYSPATVISISQAMLSQGQYEQLKDLWEEMNERGDRRWMS